MRFTLFDLLKSLIHAKKEDKPMARYALAAPWYTLYNELLAMFEGDKEVRVLMDGNCETIRLYIDNPRKCAALDKVLKHEHRFGDKVVTVVCVPPNDTGVKEAPEDVETLWETAFDGNQAFAFVIAPTTPFGTLTYVVFASMVVQFFNDDLSDVYGNRTTLYQNIATDLFQRQNNENFCTEHAEHVSVRQKNWP